jgi:hypothetical protein
MGRAPIGTCFVKKIDMTRLFFIAVTLTVFNVTGLSQTVVVTDDNSVTTGDPSSVLDLVSTAKGFLAPRMTQVQRGAISNPAPGLLVYQTDGTTGYYYYNGAAWLLIANTGEIWAQDGNSLAGIKNFGTVSNHDLPFIANNSEYMRLSTSGKLGIGSNAPEALLHVKDATPAGNTVAGLFEGNKSTGANNNVMLKLANTAGASSATIFEMGHKTSGNRWQMGTDVNGNNSDDFYLLYVAGSLPRLYIKGNTGFTGINTPNPGALLHVKSLLAPTSDIHVGKFEGEANSGSTVSLALYNTSLSNYRTSIGMGNPNGAWAIGNDIYGNTDQNFFIYDSASFATRLFIDNAGRIGLGGNLNPTEVLDVTGNAKFSGNITGGVWNGTVISPSYGGTGVNNGSNTISLSGSLIVNAASTISGNLAVASGKTLTANNSLTLAGPDGGSYTLPASGTLVNTGVTTLSSLSTVGTITTGTWDATTIAANRGGTGQSSYTLGDLLYASGSTTLGKIPGNTTTTTQFLSQTGNGSTSAQPSWETLTTNHISNIIKTSVTITNTSNVTTSNPLELTVTVTGAQPNATVILNPRADLTTRLGIAYCYVSAADTVRIVFICTNGTIQLGSNKEFDVTVINP